MLGWKADVVLRDLEDYVRSGGDKDGYIPPASFFDPVSGEIPPGSLAGRPDGNTRQIDGARQTDRGAAQGRDTDRYSTMPAPAKSGDTAMPGAVRPDQRRYDGSTPIDSLDDLLPDANNAR